MSALGRVVLRNVGSARKIASASAGRRFSSLIDRKEQAEESRYIRSQEDKRNAALQDRMKSIMAKEDSDAEKKELLGLLGKLPAELFFFALTLSAADKSKEEEEEKIMKTGIFNRLHLNDWKVAVPVGALALVGPLNYGVGPSDC